MPEQMSQAEEAAAVMMHLKAACCTCACAAQAFRDKVTDFD